MRQRTCEKHSRYQKGCLECQKKLREYKHTEKAKKSARERMRRWRATPEGKKRSREIGNRSRIRHREQRLEDCRKWRLERKMRLFALLGGKCVNCGETDVRVLTINHKNGRPLGYRQILMKEGINNSRKNAISGYWLYDKILKGDDSLSDIEIRCCNCNALYEYERGKRFYPKGYPLTVVEWEKSLTPWTLK